MKKYTADGLEDDLNHDPTYQAGLKRLQDLADRSNGVVNGSFRPEPAAPAEPTDAERIEDMKTLSHMEGQIDAGAPITQAMYNKLVEIEMKYRPK